MSFPGGLPNLLSGCARRETEEPSDRNLDPKVGRRENVRPAQTKNQKHIGSPITNSVNRHQQLANSFVFSILHRGKIKGADLNAYGQITH